VIVTAISKHVKETQHLMWMYLYWRQRSAKS